MLQLIKQDNMFGKKENKQKNRKKLLTLLDFLDNSEMKMLFIKIFPPTHDNKELISMTVKIHQMLLLVQLQKVTLLDCKEIFMKSMEDTKNFHSMFWKPGIPHFLLCPLIWYQ